MIVEFVFFFQAEDGIRDYKVTGVQTCALPICPPALVRRRLDLTREIGSGEPERFHELQRGGIAHIPLARVLARLFQFVAALLNARVVVDQPFTSVTHVRARLLYSAILDRVPLSIRTDLRRVVRP